MKKFDIALDVDEVLALCLEQSCQVLGIDPQRVTDWNLGKTDLSEEDVTALMTIICSPEFVKGQAPYPGAVEMVQELVNDGHRIIIATVVGVECMANRTEMLLHHFPMLSGRNIMMGSRKELLRVDFLLDDNPYNLGQAKRFVLMERWYNRSVKGFRGTLTYRFLAGKLREGEALYFVFLDGVPALNAEGEHVKALAFTTEEAAQEYCGRKLLIGYPLYAERKDGREVYPFFADLGVSALLLDKKAVVALSDLTELPDYDGFAGVGKPLRNTELNAALCLGRQERVAGKQAAIGYFAAALRIMREGHILACGIRSEGAEGNGSETIIPYIEDEEGRQARYL